MRRLLAVLGVSLGLAGAGTAASLVAVGTTRAVAATEKTFLIPANDGYGVAECLMGASSCGQVVADAWCEAQGFAKSVSYGVAQQEDFTGAIAEVGVGTARQDPPLRITCRD